MRNNFLIAPKLQGFIVRRSAERSLTQKSRMYSVDTPISSSRTLTVDSPKVPGQIRILKKDDIQKKDQKVFYNSDVYARHQKMIYTNFNYEEKSQSTLPAKSEAKQNIEETTTRKERKNLDRIQQTIEEQLKKPVKNIHGSFDLSKYQQLYEYLKHINDSLTVSEIEMLHSIRKYLGMICKYNFDDVSQMKFAATKKQLIKQSLARQRQTVIILCFCVAVGKFQKLKSYCSNLMRLAVQNYLIVLNVLTQEHNNAVQKLLRNQGKQHLLGKGFQFLRTTNQLMGQLIYKIAKMDPLFAGEFFKIIDSYASHSVKSLLYSMFTFFAFYINAVKSTDKIPFLAVAPAPFLMQPLIQQYTLVIDFVQVFMNQSIPIKKQLKTNNLSLRPYTSYFLGQMSKYYEIVSFSDLMPIQCNKLISKIDQKKIIKNRLYRFHIDYEKKNKDMNKIGRNINTLILLDTHQDINNKNIIAINPWKGLNNDAQLAEICPLLAMIAVKKLSALVTLQKIREATAKNASLGLKYINCGLNI